MRCKYPACGSNLQVERTWNKPDILNICLSPELINQSCSMVPSKFLTITINKEFEQIYQLSSARDYHWLVLSRNFTNIKVEDGNILVIPRDYSDDQYREIFFYENVCMPAGPSLLQKL